jgi:hypothetical protein
MNRVGRNDPCPCGSGKKYKRCCSGKVHVHATSANLFTSAERVSAIKKLRAFADREEFNGDRAIGQSIFWGGLVEGIDPDQYDRVLMLPQCEIMFNSWLLFDLDIEDGNTIGDLFLSRPGVLLSTGERAYIERAKDTFVGLYEVEDLRRGEGLSLVDLWSGARYWVRERLATHSLHKWDLIAARLMQVPDGHWVVEAGLFQYMPRHREELLKEIRTKYNHFQRLFPGAPSYAVFKRVAPFLAHLWLDLVALAPPPTVITSERDPVMFTKLRFDVIEPERLYTLLRGCSDLRETEPKTFTWWEQTDDGWRSLGTIRIDQEHLVGETNSRQRAERLRALLESVAGTAIRYRATALQDLHQALSAFSQRPYPKRESFIPPELERQVLTEYKERHYRTWPDHPLPALGGRTPRQAARLKTWRSRVISVLKDMENSEARIAEQGGPTYDFSWIWKELQLEP